MRTICVFTGTRAEYGLLKPLMDLIAKDGSLRLQVVVSGAHLSRAFGATHKAIEKDGIKVSRKVSIPLNVDKPAGLADSIGTAIERLTRSFESLQPDIVVVLGDRYETFAAATAAMVCKIPIAHLHGGEATLGALDEAMRHAVTKMSHLHFTSTEIYHRRVIQLGEAPSRVFKVGAIGLDNIRNLKLLSREELEADLGMRFGKKNFLVTFHPATLEKNGETQLFNLLSVLRSMKDAHFIFTKANADPLGRRFNAVIDMFVLRLPLRAYAFSSLGQLRYLSMMKLVDAVIGNSSSGIIEAPSFKVPTINIGSRQKGRLAASSVVHCEATKKDIQAAFKKIGSAAFQRKLKSIKNPYGDGKTAARIVRVLKNHPLDGILIKTFYDKD